MLTWYKHTQTPQSFPHKKKTAHPFWVDTNSYVEFKIERISTILSLLHRNRPIFPSLSQTLPHLQNARRSRSVTSLWIPCLWHAFARLLGSTWTQLDVPSRQNRGSPEVYSTWDQGKRPIRSQDIRVNTGDFPLLSDATDQFHTCRGMETVSQHSNKTRGPLPFPTVGRTSSGIGQHSSSPSSKIWMDQLQRKNG